MLTMAALAVVLGLVACRGLIGYEEGLLALAPDGMDAGDAGAVRHNSCADGGIGLTNCGGDGGDGDGGTETCCASIPVPGDTFSRSYDGDGGAEYNNQNYSATVAGFQLDKYEVTVGRFRKFVEAGVRDWKQSAGSGKHTHLNGESGLKTLSEDGASHELGWEANWDVHLPTTRDGWDTQDFLACDRQKMTWTPKAEGNENLPINCIDWYQALAFCIWDGGFLPSEAEWNYAAAGGKEQRPYPWSEYPNRAIDSTEAVYCEGDGGCPAMPRNVGSKLPIGLSFWGHSDMAGNVSEWTIDSTADGADLLPYDMPCENCAHFVESEARVFRGGQYDSPPSALLVSKRKSAAAALRSPGIGVRCARTP